MVNTKKLFFTPMDLWPFLPIYLGSHLPIGGGIYRSIKLAKELGATALQIFTKNQRQWRVPELKEDDIERFKKEWINWGNYPIFAHVSYLINLASPKKNILERSIESFVVEINRASSLGIKYIVVHPGSHLGDGEQIGLKRFVDSLDLAIEISRCRDMMILLETTAGQGTNLGHKFSHLAWIIENSRYSELLGVCLDTCHIFAAGYDIKTDTGYKQTFKRFKQQIGINKLKLIHINDSKSELGSKKDRHEHIGLGRIGLMGFMQIVNDMNIFSVPKILETPKGPNLKEDRINMDILIRLIVGKEKYNIINNLKGEYSWI